jgi:hypothetical protein
MRSFQKQGRALAFAGLLACGMVTLGPALHAAGPGDRPTPGYCKVLAVGIEQATALELTDLAAYLQSVYDEYCS